MFSNNESGEIIMNIRLQALNDAEVPTDVLEQAKQEEDENMGDTGATQQDEDDYDGDNDDDGDERQFEWRTLAAC